ncbi:hypothetical protein GCM10009648_37440 [Tsukamurella spumae]
MREPRVEDQTICTAVAPDAVFTVLTYATPAAYEPTISAHIRTKTSRSHQVSELHHWRSPIREPSQVHRLPLTFIAGQGGFSLLILVGV